MAKVEVLIYKLERFDFCGVARFLICHRKKYRVLVSASLYEAYLFSRRKPKKGTSGLILQHILFLYSWADSVGVEIEPYLFSGRGLQLPEIYKFVNWLQVRSYKGKKLSDSYISHIMLDCKNFVIWFVKRYVKPRHSEPLNITIYQAVIAHKKAWEEYGVKVQNDLVADDISDKEYEAIESYFRCDSAFIEEMQGTGLRNYIIWRLAWEFGLRIGEILALRVQDLNLIADFPYISIVSLSARSKTELDPRSPYQPKVKTLSRELGFIFTDSSLIRLLEIYIVGSRNRDILKSGRVVKSVFLEHDFLFVVHDGSGRPISCSAAQKISATAAENTGVIFNWHLVRHAFFNRRYAEASVYTDNANLIDNLIYWGGWKSAESLKRYTRRATRDIARSGLIMENKKYEL